MAIALAVLQFSCAKSISGRTDNLAPLNQAKTDTGAGNWQTILLAGPTDFPVAAPLPVNNPLYVADQFLPCQGLDVNRDHWGNRLHCLCST